MIYKMPWGERNPFMYEGPKIFKDYPGIYLVTFIMLTFFFCLIFIIYFILVIFDSSMFCVGDTDKFSETMKQSDGVINSSVSGNNIQNKIDNPNINIDNPNINIQNSDINIPSSVGTAVAQAANSSGISTTTVAGIRAMTNGSRNLPPTTRAIKVVAGGLGGGLVFAAGNYANRFLQNQLDVNNNYKDVNNNSKNGPFPSNSVIEEGDNVESIINFLYFNLFINICILFLVILLFYLLKKND